MQDTIAFVRSRFVGLLKKGVPFLAALVAAYVGWSIVSVPLGRSHPLVLAMAGLVLCVTALRPILGMLVMLATLLLAPLFPYEGGFTINRAFGLLTLTGLLARKAIRSDKEALVIGTFDYLCWLFSLAAILSVLFNRFYSRTRGRLWELLIGYLIYWLMTNTLNSWQKLRVFLIVMLVCTLVVSLSAINVALTSADPMTISRVEGIRAENYTGLLSYVGIIVTLWLSSGFQGRKRFLGYVLLPIFIAAMFLSGNRSGLLALVVSVLVLVVFSRSFTKGVSYALAIIPLVIGVAFLVSSIAPLTVQRALDIPVQAIIAPNLSDPEAHVVLAQAAWRMFLDHPILGVGMGGFYKLVQSYQLYYPGIHGVPHNAFTGTLAEGGLVGIGILLLIYREVVLGLWTARTKSSTEQDVAIYALALLVGANVVNAMFHGEAISRLMFVVFALGAIVTRLVDNEGNEDLHVTSSRVLKGGI